jgi:iron complex transport system substrate-binding protein
VGSAGVTTLRALRALRSVRVLLAGLALAVCGHAAHAGAVALRDDLGREVAFTHPPQRVITLLPSLTETVCALDACGRLVATDRYSNWPAAVGALPKAGGLDDAAVEVIVGLKPDLVLLSRSQRITDRLSELGIPSFALTTETYADIGRNIEVIGRILGIEERAATLARSIDDTVRQISERAVAARHGAGPRVYFEVDRAPYAAGPRSFIGELLERLGTQNIVTADLGYFPKLNPEYVVRQGADVIFVSPQEAPRLAQRPGWDGIRAVREHRLCSFSSEVNDSIVRPGPRVPEGMRALADCLARVAP